MKSNVIDLFCGAGGFALGFQQRGFNVVRGYDIDDAAIQEFPAQTGAPCLAADLCDCSEWRLTDMLWSLRQDERWLQDAPLVVLGGPPCQPFSPINTTGPPPGDDPRALGVEAWGTIVTHLDADVAVLENVPRLTRLPEGKSILRRLTDQLEGEGYAINSSILNCAHYGVPQYRQRFFLIASRHGRPLLPSRTHLRAETVRSAIGHLPPVRAGQQDADDPMHIASALSPLNMRRIQASVPGGDWRSWPADLQAPRWEEAGRTFYDVYGRMSWDFPAATITAQAGYGQGRFGHPEQDRPITLREIALLQGWPPTCQFGQAREFKIDEIKRLLGNSVPPLMAACLADAVARHLDGERGVDLLG